MRFRAASNGWLRSGESAGGSRAFALGTRILGDNKSEFVGFQEHQVGFGESGTLDGWVRRVARRCRDHRLLVFAISAAFAQVFEVQLGPGVLTAAETGRARELCEEKYSSPAWTNRA